jgi:hypothetical protein
MRGGGGGRGGGGICKGLCKLCRRCGCCRFRCCHCRRCCCCELLHPPHCGTVHRPPCALQCQIVPIPPAITATTAAAKTTARQPLLCFPPYPRASSGRVWHKVGHGQYGQGQHTPLPLFTALHSEGVLLLMGEGSGWGAVQGEQGGMGVRHCALILGQKHHTGGGYVAGCFPSSCPNHGRGGRRHITTATVWVA